jgi:ABC-2 type transport system ATP-binding protein
MSYAVQISGLNKIYKKKLESFQALDDIHLNIEGSSIFGLLGPNGVGKSTLINIIAGTVRKTSGSVKVFGIDLDSDPQAFKRIVGVVPQEIVLDTFFNLRDYLELFAGYYDIPKQNRKSEEILDALDLLDKAHLTQRELSGGMRRRFLIAKALVHSPKLLILDEPTAGVDIDLRNQLWEYVKKLNSQGICIILTTHYLLEAENLCDKIGFINKGRIIKIDNKDNLLKNIDSKSIEIICENIDNNLDQLSKLDWIKIVDKDKIIIHIKSNEVINKKLEALIEIGVNILDIRTKNSNLETVFTSIIANS